MKPFGTLLSGRKKPLPAAPFEGSQLRLPVFASSQIRGCVDGIFEDEIRGWIVDEADPDRYIKLCLIAEGKFVEKTSTCIFRKDLEQLYKSKGLHGFAFRVPEKLRAQNEITVEIRLEDSRRVCGPSVLRNSSPPCSSRRQERKPCLLLMHIPKTAVTAVRSALRSDPMTDRQLWLYGEPPGLPIEHILHLTEPQLRRAECVVGHFAFGLHMFLPQPTGYATILRDPVDRCISHYFQERFKSGDPEHPAARLTLEEFVHSCPGIAYDNLMVRMITGMGPVPLGSVTRDLLREAIDNIHQNFVYMGLQQRTIEAVDGLARYLNIKPNPLALENVGLYERQTCATPVAIRKLREFNEFDVELFDYVKKQFWSTGADGWVS